MSTKKVCLLGSEDEIDKASNNNRAMSKSGLPSHLDICENTSGSRYDQPHSRNSTETRHSSSLSRTPERGCCSNPAVFPLAAAAVCAIGGVIFGYDIGIISGAQVQLAREFELTCFQQEIVVSSMLVGAIISACVSGFIVDFVGRKRAIIINTVVFVFGAAVLTSAINLTLLVIGRVIVGFAVALSVLADCVYVSEISPAKRRGMLVSLNEFAITVGFLLAYLSNYAFINFTFGWRIMFGLSAFPAVAQGIGMCFLPKSPRYLLIKEQDLEARQVLERIHGSGRAEIELDLLKAALAEERAHSIWDLLRSQPDNMRNRLGIGLALVLMQQLTGQPNVLYYAPIVLEQVGYEGESASVLASVGLGAVKVVSCLLTLALLDSLGRRKLMIFGAIAMTLSITALGMVSFVTPQIHVAACNPSLVHSVEEWNFSSSTNVSPENEFTTVAIPVNSTEYRPGIVTSAPTSTIATATSTVLATTTTTQPPPTTATTATTTTRRRATTDDTDEITTDTTPTSMETITTTFESDSLNSNREALNSQPVIDNEEGAHSISTNLSNNGTNEKSTTSPITQPQYHKRRLLADTLYDAVPKSNMTETDKEDEDLSKAAVVKLSGLVLLCIYVGAYELSFGTGTWLILAEIFPSALRGRAFAVASVLNFAANFLISATFLDILNAAGSAGMFLPYGAVCLLSAVWLWLFLPETAGRSLEDIGQEMAHRKSLGRTLREQLCCACCCHGNIRDSSYRQLDGHADSMILSDRMELHESD